MAAATLTGLSLAAMASPAGAAVTTTTVSAVSQKTVLQGKSGAQPAGDWSIVQSGGGATAVSTGDTITLTISSGPANCTGGGNTLGFAATPNVASTPTVSGTTTPTWTATLSGTASCTPAGFNDILTLKANGNGAASTISVTGVTYTVGSAVALGAVTVTPGGTSAGVGCGSAAPPATGCSNAIVAQVAVTANNPAVGLQPGTTANAISPFVVTEGAPAAIKSGQSVCFSITSGNATFTVPPAGSTGPTIAVSGGGAGASMVSPQPSATQEEFTVNTQSSTAPATFTMNGLQVDTTAAGSGAILITAVQGSSTTNACSSAAPPPAGNSTIAAGVTAAAVIPVVRLAGQDRYDTARLLAEKKFPCAGTPTTTRFAVLARGDAFPDALAGAYVASHRPGPAASSATPGSPQGSPILLTDPNTLSGPTATALRDLGINQVIVLGLQGAVSDAVVGQLKQTQATDCTGTPATNAQGNALMITVQRIGGGDRFETARLLAECAGCVPGTLATNGQTGTGVPTAIVASGGNFPDALAAGPIANKGTNSAANGAGALPLLLTNTAALSPQAQQGLSDLGIKQVIIPGGTAAVSAATATSISNMGINVIRLAGADRTDTAAQIAAFMVATPSATVGGLGYNTNFIQLARGDDFPDALAGGPYAGVTIAPIVLTSSPSTLGQFTTAYLQNHNSIHSTGGIVKIAIFGGTVAVTSDAQNAAVSALSS